MKYLPLVWAGLMRKPARSAFTLLSVVVAFLLFGMLQGINAGYSAVIEAQHLDRLLTDPRVPGGAPMPFAAVAKIERLPAPVVERRDCRNGNGRAACADQCAATRVARQATAHRRCPGCPMNLGARNVMRQIAAASLLNLRNLPQRSGSSLVIVIGITGVVAVLISVLALSTGFRRTIDNSARADRAIVLSRGAESEGGSGLPRAAVAIVLDAPGIRRNADGRPVASAETLIVAPVARKSDGTDAYMTLRGVGPLGTELRSEVRLVAGRMFQPAVHELIVGRAAQTRFAGIEIGDRITLRGGEWSVVGVFESGGNSHESGMLADAETVFSAYQARNFASVTVQLAAPESFNLFKDALTTNPSLEVEVKREPDYVATVSRPLHRILDLVAYSIGGIMAIGALFGALNTLYSAVSARSREIATLRAIGFGSGAIVISVFIEALLLTLLGACIGATIAYAFFNGHAISTIGGTLGGSQLIYQLIVTRELIFFGIALAMLLGFLGGLFPAIRAARLPIAAALRATQA